MTGYEAYVLIGTGLMVLGVSGDLVLSAFEGMRDGARRAEQSSGRRWARMARDADFACGGMARRVLMRGNR